MHTPLPEHPKAPLTFGTRVSKLFFKLYAPISMAIGLLTLAALCLLWWPFALLVGVLPLKAKYKRYIGRQVIHYSMRFYLAVLRYACFIYTDIQALRTIPQQQPMVWAANHPALLDILLFTAAIPNMVCIMKAALQNNILYGAATRLAGYVGNTNPMYMVRASCKEITHGSHLVIFPESTRTTQWPLNPCSTTGAVIALRAQVPIQEVFITMSSPYLGKDWPLFKPPSLPLHVRLELGQRITPDQHTSPRQIIQQFEDDLRQHFSSHASNQ